MTLEISANETTHYRIFHWISFQISRLWNSVTRRALRLGAPDVDKRVMFTWVILTHALRLVLLPFARYTMFACAVPGVGTLGLMGARAHQPRGTTRDPPGLVEN